MTAPEPAQYVNALLSRLRSDLAWLREDGYEEVKVRIVRWDFDVTLSSEWAQLVISVNPGMSEIETWITRPGPGGVRAPMQRFLEARGLPAPAGRIDARSRSAVEKAIDQHADALKLLRGYELAGNWVELPPSDYMERRAQIMKELTDGHKPD